MCLDKFKVPAMLKCEVVETSNTAANSDKIRVGHLTLTITSRTSSLFVSCSVVRRPTLMQESLEILSPSPKASIQEQRPLSGRTSFFQHPNSATEQ